MVVSFLKALKRRYGISKAVLIYGVGVGVLGLFPVLSLSTVVVVGFLLLTSLTMMLGAVKFKEEFGENRELVLEGMKLNTVLLSLAIAFDSVSPSLVYMLGGIGGVSKSYLGIVLLAKPFVSVSIAVAVINLILAVREIKLNG
jgi:hypothetical protein